MRNKVQNCREVALLLLITFSCGVFSSVLPQAQSGAQRPLTCEDLSRLEQIGDHNVPYSFSPDGKYLAFVLVRAKETVGQMNRYRVSDEERSDIWLAPVTDGRPRNITNGATDGSGYFMPSWSPDGARLAMISTNGDGFRLWVWQRASEQKQLVTERSVNYWFSDEPSFVWISNEQIVCSVLPEGKRPGAIEQRKLAAQTAIQGWQKAWAGQESTANVIDSGVPVDLTKRPQGQLLLLDVITGKSKVIDTGTFRALKLSPDKKHIAVLKQTTIFQPDADRSLATRSFRRFASLGYQVVIATTTGQLISSELAQIENAYTMEWSRDSRQVAVIGEQPGDPDSNLKTFVYDIATQSLRKVLENAMDPPKLIWSASNHLLVKAGEQGIKKGAQLNRSDWWLVTENQPPRNVTGKMPRVPAELHEGPLETIVGVADGNLWEINLDGTAPRKVSVGLDSQIASIVWPNRSTTEQGTGSRFVLEAVNDNLRRYFLVDLNSNSRTEVIRPDAITQLVDFNSQSNTAVMKADARNGTYLWFSQPGSAKPILIRETNTFLRDIAEGEQKQIEYRSLDGQPLKGWVILPVNYQPGRRYPLVTWVYPGTMYGGRPSERTSLNYSGALNLHLLSGYGYAVLLPSIPIKPPGQVSEVYMELNNGVIPAVDKLIDMGIADPERLAVMGHSWGGYATFSLITQTNRFRAAIGIAGYSDYVSFYGEFPLNRRYTDAPQEFPRTMYDIEGTSAINVRIGTPPWKDIGLYLRNSPLFYVQRVETPVMIIHGDMDAAVPIEQAEQFYSALYRQNKRVRFVRYWGEGHVVESPANIEDMWQRIHAWLDELLGPT